MKSSKYFRISVTGKCNFDCPFCHREGNPDRQDDALTVDEIVFACAVARSFGFEKFKLTGGEPTLHRDILKLVNALSKMDLPDLSMITNGSTLKHLAQPLWDNGLRRINVTLNTLRPEQLRRLTRHVPLGDILCGIEQAVRVGFRDTKLNFVYTGEGSDADLADLITYAGELGLTLVVLPVISESSHYTLQALYSRVAEYGILHETEIVDREGIRKTLITLRNGSKVLLRRDELACFEPFVFCRDCPRKSVCREGIFPLRLSCSGALIACMANPSHKIEVREALRNRDEAALSQALTTMESWYRS